jgi:hypothetical protein
MGLQNTWRRIWPRLKKLASGIEARAEGSWRRQIAWDAMLVAGAGFAIYYYLVPPPAGRASLLLAVVAVAVSIPDIKYTRRWALIAVMFAFVADESRSIDADNKKRDRDFANILDDNRTKTLEILRSNRIKTDQILADNRDKTQKILSEDKSIADISRENLLKTKEGINNITGGSAFPYIAPQNISPDESTPIGLVIWNAGNYTLSGVHVIIRRTTSMPWPEAEEVVGTIPPHASRNMHMTITPTMKDVAYKPGDRNYFDSYMIYMTTQNGVETQILEFRPSKNKAWLKMYWSERYWVVPQGCKGIKGPCIDGTHFDNPNDLDSSRSQWTDEMAAPKGH